MNFLPQNPYRIIQSRGMLLWALSLAVLIFVMDVNTPLGIAGGVPYVVAILLTLWISSSSSTWMMGGLCGIFTLLGWWLSPPGGDEWSVLTNRGVALFAIGTTMILSHRYKKQAESQNQRLTFAIDQAMEGMALHREDGTFVYVNPALAKMYGYGPQELLGRSWKVLYGETEISLIEQKYLPILRKEGYWRGDLTGKRKSGSSIAVEVSLTRLEENGVFKGWLRTCRDISERKIAEKSLQQQEAQFRDLYESAPLAYFSVSSEGTIVMVNSCAEELLGYSRQDLIGKPVLSLYPPTADGVEKATFLERVAQRGEEIKDEELQMQKADGSIIWVNLAVRLVWNDLGRLLERRSIVQDITGKKETQAHLLRSEYRYRSVVEIAGSVIVGLDGRFQIFEWNREAERLFGFTREEVWGKNYLELFLNEEERPAVAADIQKVLEGTPTRDFEKVVTIRDGSQRILVWNVDRVMDADQSPVGVIAIGLDVTESKRAQQALYESEARLHAILDNSPGLIFLKDLEGRYLHVNQQFKNVFGFHDQSPIGQTDDDLFPLPQALAFKSHDRRVIESKKMLEFEEVAEYADGMHTSIVHKFPLFNQQGDIFAIGGITTDITRRKQAEEALFQSETTLKRFFDSSPMMMGIVELEGEDIRHVTDNQATGKFFGTDPETLVDRLSSHLGVPQSVIDLWVSHYRISASSGKPVRFEYQHLGGNSPRWVSVTVSCITGAGQGTGRFAYIAEEVTQRKYLEEKLRRHAAELESEVTRRTERIQELEQRRMQVEKLAALAQVAAGIAHEINNPLAGIGQSLVLLRRTVSEEHPRYKYLQRMQESVDRMAHITQQLYLMYGSDSLKPSRFDWNQVIHDSLDIMKVQTKKQEVCIACQLPPGPTWVQGQRSAMIQVLCNIVQNGIDVSKVSQTISLILSEEERWLKLEIRDQGPGIPPDVAPYVFDPFFTTKVDLPERRMGLGLSVSFRLMESMNGRLDFDTKFGHGTTFRIIVPRATREIQS